MLNTQDVARTIWCFSFNHGNHDSHLSIDAVDFCRANGIVILTLPPHTSNKLQPLDRTVFGPFKTFYNQAADAWMISHPGETISIYDIPLLALQSWDRAASPVNIKSGFRCTGIVPFDRNIFSEQDFLSSAVTDRCLPETETLPCPAIEHLQSDAHNDAPSTSSNNNDTPETNKPKEKSFITPEAIKPFPKAAARKESNRGRKRGRCIIATDTPEKLLIEEKKKQKENRKTAVKKKEQVKRKCLQEELSEEENETIVYNDNSSDDSVFYESEEETSIEDIKKGSYIIANVFGKLPGVPRKYVAIIDEKFLKGYEVRFLKRHLPSNRFSFTEEPPATVYFKDVVTVLPNPSKDQRARFRDMVYFNVDLTEYSLQ